ncbi:hypothetical protein [Natronosalvus caseinilyticus]|uniref:hypothetical protein n=1 Tax=Natronosalvus caseinilyticus TaxID=2953747 RepID=UPI0028AAD296|nr:hypothetical protein [Natronosalvus caseinilyticus]
MTIGSDGTSRLLAVLAVGCAIGGIVLAASAMPMLAADSPVATALGDGETSAERDRAIQEAMLEAAAEGDGDLAGRADELGASDADGEGLRTGGSGAGAGGTGAGASGGAGAGAFDNQLVQAAALSAMEDQHDLLTNPVVSDALFGLAGIYAAIGGSPGDFAAGAADSDPGAYDDPGDLEPSAYDDPANLEGAAPEDLAGTADEPMTSGGLLDVPTSANGLEGGYGDLVTDQRAGSTSLEGDGAGGPNTDAELDSSDGFDANANDGAWDEDAAPDDSWTDDPTVDPDASQDGDESGVETTGGTEDSSASDVSDATDATDASDDETNGAEADGTDSAKDDETNSAETDGTDSAEEETNSMIDSLEDSLGPAGERPILTLLAVALTVVVGYVFVRTDDPIATLRALPGRLLAVAMGVVVACSRALERAYAALCGLRSIAELPGLLLGVVAGILAGARTKARSVRASLPFVGEGIEADPEAATPDDRPTARVRIREAFADVAAVSTVSRLRVATPTDVAEGAKARGVPAEPVETITDAFRDVEYGGRDPERRLERTTAARATIRSSLAAGDESADDAPSDGDGDASRDANENPNENSTGDP